MSNLPLYLSAPHQCSYRPEQMARSVFVDPRMSLNSTQRNALANVGFRRSGPSFYRPACVQCQACVSTRVDVQQFRANRSQRRCLRSNADLIASWAAPVHTEKRFNLYQRYLKSRHQDGDMDPDDAAGFERFLCTSQDGMTRHLLIRDHAGELLAVCVADRLASGWSAVYTFFDPLHAQRSLGRYAVLRLIDTCKADNLPWLYLGYFIADCRKMNYKSEYQPQQRYVNEAWEDATD